MAAEKLHHHILPTPIGAIAFLWSAGRSGGLILRVLLPCEDQAVGPMVLAWFPDATPGSCSEVEILCVQIISFLQGDPLRLPLQAVALDQCGFFQRSVLLAEYGIPRGAVSTYERIARHVGRPGGARAVGNALAHNPFPLIIPCHRAIRSDLTLGGFQGGLSMKRRLLEMEGVRFDRDGRVIPDPMHY